MTRILTHLDQEVATAIADFHQNPREGWWWVSSDRTVSLEGIVNPGEPPMVQMTDTQGCVVDGEFGMHLEEVVRLSDGEEPGDPAFVTFGDRSWEVDVTRLVRSYNGTEYLVVIARQE